MAQKDSIEVPSKNEEEEEEMLWKEMELCMESEEYNDDSEVIPFF